MKLARAFATLTWISFRRQVWSASSLMVCLPLGAAAAFVGWTRYDLWTSPGHAFVEFSRDFVILLFAGFVLPIVALAYGTTGIGGDREDKTLVFVLSRPIPRGLVLLAKLMATLPLTVGLAVACFWLCCRLAGDAGELAARLYLPAVLLTSAAYTTLFQLFAVVFRHSTIIALVYALFIEFIVGNLPGIIKQVAVNYYGRMMMFDVGSTEGLPLPRERWFEPMPAATAAWWLVGIAAGGLLVSMWLFQRREYRDLT